MDDKLFKMKDGVITHAPCACCGKVVDPYNRALGRCNYCGGKFEAMLRLFMGGIDPRAAHLTLQGRRGYKKMDDDTVEQLLWIKKTKGEGH